MPLLPSYWGGAFPQPELGQASYWGGVFPEGLAPDGPATVASFEIALEQGSQVTWQWQTDIIKTRRGTERRASLLDLPRETYRGPMLLLEEDTRIARTRLAQFAALGQPFLVGLTYESVAVLGAATASTGTWTIPTTPTAMLDWAVVGQRIIADNRALGVSVAANIVSVTSDSITIDANPGTAGATGGRIMPGVATLLDPQQGFDRYPVKAQRWNVSGRAATFGFADTSTTAELALSGTTTTGLVLRAKASGVDGNAINVVIQDGASDAASSVFVLYAAGFYGVTFTVQMGTSTLADFAALVTESALLELVGDYDETITMIGDAMAQTPLAGGGAVLSEIGRGATVTTFRTMPIWTAGITVEDTVADSIQSMHDVEDLGGVPFAVGAADTPDWGRALSMRRGIYDRAGWQYLRRFCNTIRGRWKSFWLPTFAADLVAVSVGAGTLTVEAGLGGGDVFSWWPSQRDSLWLRPASGAPVFARISNVVDNGDGTATLSLVDEDDVPVTLAAVPRLVSWLERCRLESDDVTVAFDKHGWSTTMQARVVQAGEETSAPREVFEIVLPTQTYRLASGVRAIEVNGDRYDASPVQRGQLKISNSSGTASMEFTLPVSHPLVERYVQQPPRTVQVTITRVDGADVERIWTGYIASVSLSGNVATFLVPPIGAQASERMVPTLTAGRTCRNALYDARCTVDPASFTVSTTTTSVDGRTVKLASIGGNVDGWATFGEFIHVASGESMLIADQVGTTLTLRSPFVGLGVGDAVQVRAGCAHDAATCRDKFANVDNFVGQPNMPEANPFKFGSLGFLLSE